MSEKSKPVTKTEPKEEHVKKHDHSFLGKHNKKEKKAYLEALAKDQKPKEK